jgi:uncharacterized protein (TIGR02594 family)
LRPGYRRIDAHFRQAIPRPPKQQGTDEMQHLARVAIGLTLLAMATPNSLLADPYINDMRGQQTASMPTKTFKARKFKAADASTLTTVADLGAPRWISVARGYTGTNPTNRKSLWCADFLNLVLQRSGMKGTSSSMAGSFASYGQRLSGPRVGAIAVISRGRTAAHVGIVTGIDSSGNPILISGNHNNTVAEAPYPAGRVIAYVWPTG